MNYVDLTLWKWLIFRDYFAPSAILKRMYTGGIITNTLNILNKTTLFETTYKFRTSITSHQKYSRNVDANRKWEAMLNARLSTVTVTRIVQYKFRGIIYKRQCKKRDTKGCYLYIVHQGQSNLLDVAAISMNVCKAGDLMLLFSTCIILFVLEILNV